MYSHLLLPVSVTSSSFDASYLFCAIILWVGQVVLNSNSEIFIRRFNVHFAIATSASQSPRKTREETVVCRLLPYVYLTSNPLFQQIPSRDVEEETREASHCCAPTKSSGFTLLTEVNC